MRHTRVVDIVSRSQDRSFLEREQVPLDRPGANNRRDIDITSRLRLCFSTLGVADVLRMIRIFFLRSSSGF